jgi:hypothetical protein
MAGGLTQPQRDSLTRQFALGRARVLAVGIDDYDRDYGFAPRATCRNDALAFADCFRDIPQLDADQGAVKALVSGPRSMPSRGEIVKALRELVKASTEGDRLIFYFSGRGHCLADDPGAYLVPQDAFATDDPGCLISLSMVQEILGSSPAAHKLMILDVCSTGSRKAFDASLRDTTGVAILASSAADAPSTTGSPNPQHSLFTALLLPALRGEEPEALADRLLTVPRLHEFLAAKLSRPARSSRPNHRPILKDSISGTMVLADFSGPLLSPDAFELDGGLFDSIEMSGGPRQIAIKEILKELSRTHYSPAYLEQRANAALGEHLAEELGRAVSRLRARFRWASSAVSAEGAGITFPDGHYAVRYEATDKTRGVLVAELSLRPAWLDSQGLVAALLECLQLDPDRITFALRKGCVLARGIAKLEASGWQITSELPHKVEATHGDCTLILEKQALTLVDLPLREMFAETPDRDAVRKAAAALAVFNG